MFLVRDLVSARTWLAMTQHLAGLLLGFAAIFIVGFGLAFGVGGLFFALVGLPLLGLTLRLAYWFAREERARFAFLLGTRIPAWPAPGTPGRIGFRWGIIPRWRMWSEQATWAELGYALLRLPVSAVAAAISIAAWAVGLILLTLPAYGPAMPSGGPTFGDDGAAHPRRADPVRGHRRAAGTGRAAADPRPGPRGRRAGPPLLGPRRDLAARVTELEISRERVVDAAEAERRRIERDLHDGAQQRLVALAMELGRAKARFADDLDAARELVDQAHAQAKEALTELRNLVRGVHPPVLTDRGLDAALSGVAALCPVPVDVHVDVPVRPKPAVEAVAYFMVAEALTNVAKHSRASHAKVVVEGHGYPGTLTVMVSDDGIGGADITSPGLAGLADRVSGVDGRLSVESPSGGPTIIAAELPCG